MVRYIPYRQLVSTLVQTGKVNHASRYNEVNESHSKSMLFNSVYVKGYSEHQLWNRKARKTFIVLVSDMKRLITR